MCVSFSPFNCKQETLCEIIYWSMVCNDVCNSSLSMSFLQDFAARCLTLPAEGEIADLMDVADPDAVHIVRRFVVREVSACLREDLLNTVCAAFSCFFFAK